MPSSPPIARVVESPAPYESGGLGASSTNVRDALAIARWREGDRTAGHRLYDRYAGPLLFFFLSLDPNHARDRLERVFRDARNPSVPLGNGDDRLELVAIALRQLTEAPRSEAWAVATVVDSESSGTTSTTPTDTRRVLRQALEALPWGTRLTLELRYRLELREDEVMLLAERFAAWKLVDPKRADAELLQRLAELGMSPSSMFLRSEGNP